MRAAVLRMGVAACVLLAGCATRPPAAANEMVTAHDRMRHVPPDRVSALLNLGSNAIEAALGPPVLRRAEGSGEVWLYAHANGCSIDIVMFPASGGSRAAHAATRTPAAMTEADCLRAIAEAAP